MADEDEEGESGEEEDAVKEEATRPTGKKEINDGCMHEPMGTKKDGANHEEYSPGGSFSFPPRGLSAKLSKQTKACVVVSLLFHLLMHHLFSLQIDKPLQRHKKPAQPSPLNQGPINPSPAASLKCPFDTDK
ncbi:hypothetical protein HPP92_028394 [Vanilla planifolia]|uniref:Uncharacterized protein n=1 Tax=Vanilla planifolia TaxID=51239 RepID=A0A835P5E7_VANPL|nr:hypothetical protein HPP92_028394 [Vanilla planifolia]